MRRVMMVLAVGVMCAGLMGCGKGKGDHKKACGEIYDKAKKAGVTMALYPTTEKFTAMCAGDQWKNWGGVHGECMAKSDKEFKACMDQYMLGGKKNKPE